MIIWSLLLQGGAQLQATVTSYTLDTTPGAYNITGSDATVLVDRLITVTPGAYNVTGSDATLLFDRLTSVTPGAYNITGFDATLATGVVLDTTPGSYSITGSNATVLYGRAVLPTPGAYNLTGSDVTFVYNAVTSYVLATEVGSYSITGFDARLTYVISGEYTQPDRNVRLEAIPTKAPNLTLPRPVYDVGQQMQLVNQLRLYFVGIDGATSSLVQITNTLNTLAWMDCN